MNISFEKDSKIYQIESISYSTDTQSTFVLVGNEEHKHVYTLNGILDIEKCISQIYYMIDEKEDRVTKSKLK